MKQRTVELLALAEEYCNELSRHPVLSEYWSELSLVIKGSVARDNPDRYSDIDLVFFCAEKPYREIIEMYYKHGLTHRDDGVFLPLGNWVGHYNLETLDKLTSYFKRPDYPQVWEYQNVVVLHDPQDRYQKLVSSLSSDLLADPLPAIKREYLDIQLTLDWLRHPLKRGDSVSVALHCAKLLQSLCRICYLLDGKCYPHDKWLFSYIGTTRFGKSNKSSIRKYVAQIANSVPRHLELDGYPQYVEGAALVERVGAFIGKYYGKLPWIAEWYLHV
ncbi:nucleotidyltransferase domain-containing protein [bacterium]|nr:nucleotidyltransferase domain-containing protein [bacterium]